MRSGVVCRKSPLPFPLPEPLSGYCRNFGSIYCRFARSGDAQASRSSIPRYRSICSSSFAIMSSFAVPCPPLVLACRRENASSVD
jgi:hypothetical protein